MKKILLPIALLLCSFIFGQIPTNGLLGSYEFTNGALTDAVNTVTLTQTGTSLTKVDDRSAVANNGLSLNGDYLTRANISYPNSGTDLDLGTISFWIKTDTDDSNIRTILDDTAGRSDATTDNSWAGYYFYIKDGKIGVSGRVEYSNNESYQGIGKLSTHKISDNSWHHIVATIRGDQRFTGTSDIAGAYVTLYVDEVSQGTSSVTEVAPFSGGGVNLRQSLDINGNVTIGNNSTNDLPDANRYFDEIDDLNFYNRQISQAEISQLATVNSFCFPPLATTISATNITETSADISWTVAGTFDLAYVPKGEPFTNAIIQTNLLQNTAGSLIHSITSLQSSTIYNVYIRKQCTAGSSSRTTSATYSSWSTTPAEVRTNGIMYVNTNATGTNDGTSWANAFTDLKDAFTILQDGSKIWVAQGVYKPSLSSRSDFFEIDKNNVELYGGFNGTEATLSQRNFRTNETILSGDLSGDDALGNFADNSYHLIYVKNNGAKIDGFTISDGVANGTATNAYGAGVFKDRPVNSLTIKNCIIKNNFALYATGVAAEYQSIGGTLDIENCIFDNNTGRFGSALYVQTRNGGTFTFNVSNSLFSNNEAKDLSGVGTGYAGSAGFFQANSSASVANVKLTNNTYVKNNDIGTHSTMNNLTRTTVGANENAGTLNLEVANCIFKSNTITGGVVANAITGMNGTLPNNTTVVNSIDEDGFSKLNAANLTNISIADPLFTSTTDFTLQATSPAINMGGNTYLPSTITTDLLGNDRISIAKIDAGAYEYQCTTCFGVNTTIVGDGTVTQTGEIYNNGDTATLTATAATDYVFEGWSGDASGTTNPLVIAVTANKSITATFSKLKTYVNKNATGNNNGTSWADAYVSLQDAVTNATTDDVIWIAAGTYKAGTTESDSFLFTADNIKVYGGFNGTEVALVDRTLINPTILSGDINGDDIAIGADGIEQNPTLSNRADNSNVIVKVDGNNLLLDGLVISDGHYNSSASGQGFGSAIYKDASVTNMTLKNCEIIKNFNFSGGAVFANFNLGGNLTVENCKFGYNTGKYASGLYVYTGNTSTLTVDVTNSLFTNNISKNLYSTQKGYTGSSIWSRAYGTASHLTTTITNSTFAKNRDIGTISANVCGTLALSRNTDGNSVHNAVVNNSIFYDNLGINDVTTLAVVQGHTLLPNIVTVANSIDENNFSNLSSLTNTSNSDPLFTDKANNDFTLQAGSPAIDSGDNTKIPSGVLIDLLGNQRISNTTVDMGAYEYDVSLNQKSLTIIATNGTVITNPNPTNGTYDDGTVVSLTATPATGYQFDGWSGDASGTTNPLSISMDADKTVTANFSKIQRVLTITTLGTGTVDIASGTIYNHGDVVTLIATPGTNFAVKEWTGDVTAGAINSIQITMDADKAITVTFESTLGIDNLNKIEGLNMYPNPTKGNLTIDLQEQVKTIELYNLQGQVVKIFTSKKVDISAISKGIYMVKITTESGKIAIKKIIKN